MCYSNFTQYSGCGHIGESRMRPLTLCDAALERLYSLRGPNSPPISPQPTNYAAPKRSASKRRFFSLSQTLSRSSSIASRQSSDSGRRRLRSASASITPSTTVPVDIDYASLPMHQVNAVKCTGDSLVRRSQVASDMDVCPECKKVLGDMRNMLERYEKTGSIRGTAAFEQFLRFNDDRNYTRGGDVTIPLRDSVSGEEHGAMQAIVLGHATDSSTMRQREGIWRTKADVGTLSDHHPREMDGPRRAVIRGQPVQGHPSEAGFLVEGGSNGLGYWKGDDVSSLATSRVFAGI